MRGPQEARCERAVSLFHFRIPTVGSCQYSRMYGALEGLSAPGMARRAPSTMERWNGKGLMRNRRVPLHALLHRRQATCADLWRSCWTAVRSRASVPARAGWRRRDVGVPIGVRAKTARRSLRPFRRSLKAPGLRDIPWREISGIVRVPEGAHKRPGPCAQAVDSCRSCWAPAFPLTPASSVCNQPASSFAYVFAQHSLCTRSGHEPPGSGCAQGLRKACSRQHGRVRGAVLWEMKKTAARDAWKEIEPSIARIADIVRGLESERAAAA
jgi:hypothetical protein